MDRYLSGVIPPVITPLAPAGDVDVDALQLLTKNLVAAGVSGVFVLGTAGEGPMLTGSQRRLAVEAVVAEAGGQVPVLVGVLEPSTRKVLEEIEWIGESGADAIVVTVPYYFECGAPQQIPHFERVIDASGIPVVLYNVPTRTGNALEPTTVAELVQQEGVIAVKDSSGNLEWFGDLVGLRPQHPGLGVLQGIEAHAAVSLMNGGTGLVPSLANLTPHPFVAMFEASQGNERELVEKLQAEVDQVARILDHGPRLACLKFAIALLGYGTGAVCHDGWELSPRSKEAIRGALEANGMI